MPHERVDCSLHDAGLCFEHLIVEHLRDHIPGHDPHPAVPVLGEPGEPAERLKLLNVLLTRLIQLNR